MGRQLFREFITKTIQNHIVWKKTKSSDGSGVCPNVTMTSVDISAEVYNFKEANEVLENQVDNCDVEKVKTEPELMNTKMVNKFQQQLNNWK